MHNLIERLFAKRGITSAEELRDEERQTLDAWLSVLNKPEPNLGDVAAVLRDEMERAQEALRSYDNSPTKDLYYKAYVRILLVMDAITTTPQKQRDELKAQLEQMLKL